MSIFSASVAVSGWVCFRLPRASRVRLTLTPLARSAFGGLIATGVSYLSGKAGLYGWQWLVSCRGNFRGSTGADCASRSSSSKASQLYSSASSSGLLYPTIPSESLVRMEPARRKRD